MSFAKKEATVHPFSARGITLEYVNSLMARHSPDVRISDLAVVEERLFGDEYVSTTGRVTIDVSYAAGAPADLPSRLIVKLALGVERNMASLYANEVDFYSRLRSELTLEAPRAYGSAYDAGSGSFALVLEDLRSRGAVFPNVTTDVSLDSLKSVLGMQAKLHAHFWDSPRFKPGGDLEWVQTHLEGPLADHYLNDSAAVIQEQIDTIQHKREMVQRLRTTGDELRANMIAMFRHRQTLPQTIVEGDMHIGNTYVLPDGTGGLTDWQLMVRSHHMHDVNYVIITGLSIEDRREYEQDLLRHYLDCLGREGVKQVPSFDETWLEYRRAIVWSLYVGWLIVPIVTYGWEVNFMNHLRLTTAYEDHETGRLIAPLL
jgi:Ecdysteroid kinase-like family